MARGALGSFQIPLRESLGDLLVADVEQDGEEGGLPILADLRPCFGGNVRRRPAEPS